MTRRTERINDQLREEISDLLHRQVKDPRLQGLVSLTEVETTPDLKHARVFVSVLGSDEEKTEAMRGLQAASGFLRHALLGRLQNLKQVPALEFRLDDSIERGSRLLQLLREVEPGSEEEK